MPVFTTTDGARLAYEVHGAGRPIVLTPGGREAGSVLAELRDALALHFTVITWDRRNCGSSSLWFDPESSEQAVWADDLAALVSHLRLERPVLAGGSAGCRVVLNTALRHPDLASDLVLWSVSGGEWAAQFLGFQYHVPYVLAARQGGMAQVAATPFFAERITASEDNRRTLLDTDPERFIAAMMRWNEDFYLRPNRALPGVLGELGEVRTPALVFAGNDDIHPEAASTRLAMALPNAELVDSPWTGEEFTDRFLGRVGESVFSLYPRLVPAIRDFLG